MGSPFIFSGSDAKALKANINFNDNIKILSGTVDPSSSATAGNLGSLYLNTSTAVIYRKTDSGSSTNWTNMNANKTGVATVVTKTGNYTATTADHLVEYDISGGSATLTLYAAASNSGRYLRVKLTATASTNALTITDGTLTVYCHTAEESYLLYSNGTVWKVIEHYIPKTITQLFTMTIGGTTSAPTKGSTGGNPLLDKIDWYRENNYMVCDAWYKQTAGGAAGSGTYIITIPGSWTADTTNITTGTNNSTKIGYVGFFSTTTNGMRGEVRIYDSTRFFFRHQLDTNSRRNWGSSSGFDLSAANVYWNAKFRIPITNWTP